MADSPKFEVPISPALNHAHTHQENYQSYVKDVVINEWSHDPNNDSQQHGHWENDNNNDTPAAEHQPEEPVPQITPPNQRAQGVFPLHLHGWKETVQTPIGMLFIVNIVLLFFCWVIVAGWRGSANFAWNIVLSGSTGFFLSVTVLPWLMLIGLFLIIVFNLHERLTFVNWSLMLLVVCVFWAFFLGIASIVLVVKAADFAVGALVAAAVFGFITTATLSVKAGFHFKQYRNSPSNVTRQR